MTIINRREFLGAAAAASNALAQEKKLKLGLIGCGWFGGVDSTAAIAAGGVEFIGLCDVDSAHLDEMSAAIEKQQGSKPKGFKHYKDLLAMDGLDGLLIATPPHWHALPFIAACERKLPIYCEKPLAYDIREGRAMVNAWKKAGNIVQIGFQRRQSEAYQSVKDYIASGAPGPIIQVDVNIHYTAQPLDNKPQDPPATLDWDLWCGPAPKLPYSPNIGHKSWRLEETTGNGHMVDWGIHLIDATRKMLAESMPKRITAVGGLYEYKGRITTPDTLTAHFEFDKCPVVWRHRLWGAVERDPEFYNGVTFYGEKETIFVTDGRWIVMPKGRNAERRVTEVKSANELSQRHVSEWVKAVRAGTQPSVSPEEAFRSTATVQLGMISYKTGRTLQWDMASGKLLNDPAANKLLARAYRAPYKHPGV
ncbi:Gfo/Idh/MocA family protein [Paludibaculum fermentans]|uniref:Gfo/Idh/MocA family oxidoreductase n=1 Tax=Paludibaculum fermentans TaxID=1473598 RepID=A0A7S7NLW3_PALFE|nr:Gfo/Idh/MocA family oxidoreductase [Paludibaculum fermentans]QOY85993.1 Gfo/Idh/MocA family oxidoreductase [Paludibaculum fermentans]